jgi:hypothetical protein
MVPIIQTYTSSPSSALESSRLEERRKVMLAMTNINLALPQDHLELQQQEQSAIFIHPH